MAWLTNLAGRAEDLLNRLDHNASIVLLQNESKDNQEFNDTEYTNGLSEDHSKIENNLTTASEEQNNDYPVQSDSKPKFITSVQHTDIEIPVVENIIVQASENGPETYISDSETASSPSECNLEIETQDSEKIVELESKYLKAQNDLSELKRKLTDSKNDNTILKSQLQQSLASLSLTQVEIERHRSKAQKILEDKERLVAQIENTPAASNSSTEQIEYVSKLMRSRDDQQKIVDELNEKLELVQSDLAATQKQCSLFKDEASAARQALQKEEKLRLTLEDELLQSKQELNKVFEELKQNIQIINTKNEELSYLQKQVETRSTSSENEELESKFHVLTKTLIMKQNSVETLTTERNALKLQLERVESDYSKVLMELNTKQTTILNIDNIDDGKSSSFFTMSPFDEGVTRRVKKAISTLNTFSIRLGVFLRRYPVARVFLLCYMILLQIWVVVILFAYVPNSS